MFNIAILAFALLLLIKLPLLFYCFYIGIALPKAIAFPTFAIVIVVALRVHNKMISVTFAIAFKSIKEQSNDNYIGSNKKKHEPIYKTDTKYEANRLRATAFAVTIV